MIQKCLRSQQNIHEFENKKDKTKMEKGKEKAKLKNPKESREKAVWGGSRTFQEPKVGVLPVGPARMYLASL